MSLGLRQKKMSIWAIVALAVFWFLLIKYEMRYGVPVRPLPKYELAKHSVIKRKRALNRFNDLGDAPAALGPASVDE
jgi:hypothetical protein